MLPLISFETGRKTQTQSCGQPAELRQPMEVWFYPRIETAAERPTPSAENSKSLHPRSSRRVGRAFALLTKTYHGSRVTVHLGISTDFGGKRVNRDLSDCFRIADDPPS